jgi:hypothetical protein
MKSAQRRRQGKGAFDLVEEATHLLRTAPAATLAAYYSGAIPFVLGFLYFWADMSRNPFAPQHLAGASLGLALLFLWMKFWQVIFARNLRAHLAAEPPPPLNFRRGARIFLTQTILQPAGLFLIPLALLPLIPFAWVYGFFQNATALAGDDSATRLAKKSWQQATLWPGQNILAVVITFAFGFFVFLNWAIVCYMLPHLAKLLFGISSIFTESPYSVLNTTFFAGMITLTYLCVDPILKAIYVLRCFYGESLQSGEDLKAELKSFARHAPGAMALLVLLGSLAGTSTGMAASPAPAAASLTPAHLNQAINHTIQERKYLWRMPRELPAEDQASQGIFARFFDKIGTMLREWARVLGDWLDSLIKKLFPAHHTDYSPSHASSGYGWILSVEIFLYGLVAVALSALAIFLYRVWLNRQKPATVLSEAIQPAPDITNENIRADQLPEDGWIRLARELLERGEFRPALRAFYLASLAHLAAKNLIRIARFKSNREYERELRRRAHSFPDLLSVFGDNLSTLERIWYGTHAADRDLVDRFAANVERIRVTG